MVLLFAVHALAVEEGCVSVAILEEREARAMSGDGALH
jgi:hypothetical protein